MRLLVVFLASALTLMSCSPSRSAVYAQYEATLTEAEIIEKIEITLKTTAKKHGFHYFEKDRREISAITQDRPAFFIALYHNDDPFFTITNAGVGFIVTIIVNDFGNLGEEKLDAVIGDVLGSTKLYGLVFRAVKFDGNNYHKGSLEK